MRRGFLRAAVAPGATAKTDGWSGYPGAPGVSHGLRRKNIQTYLDEFVFRFNRRRTRHAAMLPRLSWAAVRTPPMPYRRLKSAEAHA